MTNKIRKIDSTASPTQARATYGPATAGIEWDTGTETLVINPDGDRVSVQFFANVGTLTPTSSKFGADFTATFAATAGNNTIAWLGGQRIIVAGANLSKTGIGVAAMQGVYNVTGTNAGTLPKSAFTGEIHDNTTTADAAFVALIGGDSNVTSARAAYSVA